MPAQLVRKSWWAGRAVTTALAVEIGLRLMSLATTARLLGVSFDPAGAATPPSTRRPDPEMLQAAAATAWVLRRWPPGDTCLRRALIAGHLLRRRRPVLRLGAVSGTQGLGGHAWIELPDGRTIGADEQAVQFSRVQR